MSNAHVCRCLQGCDAGTSSSEWYTICTDDTGAAATTLDLTSGHAEGKHMDILNRWLHSPRHRQKLAQLDELSWGSSGVATASADGGDGVKGHRTSAGDCDVRLSLHDQTIDLRNKRLRSADVRMLTTWLSKESAMQPEELLLSGGCCRR